MFCFLDLHILFGVPKTSQPIGLLRQLGEHFVQYCDFDIGVRHKCRRDFSLVQFPGIFDSDVRSLRPLGRRTYH